MKFQKKLKYKIYKENETRKSKKSLKYIQIILLITPDNKPIEYMEIHRQAENQGRKGKIPFPLALPLMEFQLCMERIQPKLAGKHETHLRKGLIKIILHKEFDPKKNLGINYAARF